jgi:hypothetical protein
MNNMLMYSADRDGHEHEPAEHRQPAKANGVFVLGSVGKKYFLKSGNIMKNESVGLLKERIDHLNTLDPSGIRKFYKEKLRSEDANLESKGAGIGLIEIARRASSKITYEFTPYEEGLTFFAMSVEIGG